MPSPIGYNYIIGIYFHIYENFTLKNCIILCKKRAFCKKITIVKISAFLRSSM